MTENISRLAIPESSKEPALECPFAGVAVPVKTRDAIGRESVSLVMQRAECNSHCALYDRVLKQPGCVIDLRPQIEALTAALKEAAIARSS